MRGIMEIIKGTIKQVYIPTEQNQDIIYSNKIGFKIKTSLGILNIEEKQDEDNAKILKGDRVVITKQLISNREFIDIKKIEDDSDE